MIWSIMSSVGVGSGFLIRKYSDNLGYWMDDFIKLNEKDLKYFTLLTVNVKYLKAYLF